MFSCPTVAKSTRRRRPNRPRCPLPLQLPEMLKKPHIKTRHRSELPVEPMTVADALARLRMYLLWHHPSVQPEDLEPTSTPGYWRMKSPCSGRDGCSHPMHTAMFNEGGI